MCGIFCCFNSEHDVTTLRPKCVAMSKKQRHRGPDWSGTFVGKSSILCHERLAIVGVDTGAQPLVSADGQLALAVNGEIYNHLQLRKGLKDKEAQFRTHSDCEVILHLYREHGPELCSLLDGMFSFVLLDQSVTPARLIAARDPIGITTLYQGHHSSSPSTQYFASEMKALQDECDVIRSFPPGHVWDSSTGETTRYFKPSWWDGEKIPTTPVNYDLIRETLEMAVKKRLMSEVPYGVLLSGGLDSSLIASIAARETDKLAKEMMRKREEGMKQGVKMNGSGIPEDHALAFWPQLHSFAIGLVNAPDLIAARKAAQFLGTIHHEYTFTIDEALDSLEEIIWHLETYDVTTVRASTPMGLLSRKIKAMGVKMVLSGEGADEIFGGYLYFHLAKSGPDFHTECVQRVKNLNFADCLRANKSTMAFGLEARVPFLDKEFLEVAMNIDPKEKLFGKGEIQKKDADGRPRIEKYILRKAFDCNAPDGRPWLDESILWRQKEQFSDGVGYNWIDSLKAHAESLVTDEQLATAKERWEVDTPTTKEAYMIREIFARQFPGKATESTVVRWIPKASWGAAEDPSGRAVAIHEAAL